MKRLGIIGAMEVEVSLLREQLEAPSASQRAGMTFWSGLLRGMPVVIVPCGVGKVNAALCVQVMADLYGVTHVVNTGIAGSLDASLEIGEIVISSDVMYHDVQVGTIGNYPRGQVPEWMYGLFQWTGRWAHWPQGYVRNRASLTEREGLYPETSLSVTEGSRRRLHASAAAFASKWRAPPSPMRPIGTVFRRWFCGPSPTKRMTQPPWITRPLRLWRPNGAPD